MRHRVCGYGGLDCVLPNAAAAQRPENGHPSVSQDVRTSRRALSSGCLQLLHPLIEMHRRSGTFLLELQAKGGQRASSTSSAAGNSLAAPTDETRRTFTLLQ